MYITQWKVQMTQVKDTTNSLKKKLLPLSAGGHPDLRQIQLFLSLLLPHPL